MIVRYLRHFRNRQSQFFFLIFRTNGVFSHNFPPIFLLHFLLFPLFLCAFCTNLNAFPRHSFCHFLCAQGFQLWSNRQTAFCRLFSPGSATGILIFRSPEMPPSPRSAPLPFPTFRFPLSVFPLFFHFCVAFCCFLLYNK